MDRDLHKTISERRNLIVKAAKVPGVEGFFGQVVSGDEVLATTDTPFADADDAIAHTQQILAASRSQLPQEIDLTEKPVKEDYVQNDRVRYEAGVFIGTGSVCGRIDYEGGPDWIVSLDHRIEGYDFSHIVMRGSFLRPL
jgi:transcription antitermination factor NusG